MSVRNAHSGPASGSTEPRFVAGVDGCRSGWIVVFRAIAGNAAPRLALFPRFADILTVPEAPAIVAVDMPIGLPDRIKGTGRAAEMAVRPLLGDRQSSVFSMPARAAVMAADYGEACRIALETSTPPRKVSRQGFGLFTKVREIDALMTPALEARVYEVHPELAFWRLNGGKAMRLPKKIRNRANPAGLDERRELLTRFGFESDFLRQRPPAGSGPDDLVDACVNAVIAERILAGTADSFPADPPRDRRGLRIAIWA